MLPFVCVCVFASLQLTLSQTVTEQALGEIHMDQQKVRSSCPCLLLEYLKSGVSNYIVNTKSARDPSNLSFYI